MGYPSTIMVLKNAKMIQMSLTGHNSESKYVLLGDFPKSLDGLRQEPEAYLLF